ncbi:fumarylacetoacetate hydrolase family protein [Mesohalobacter halotolerans]|uniref:Fumarylacetoacetate hydrolase family protein n=1 Tax=Mesohalobacter halotolerans TaxID=1883405 RepID=A0A4U5TPW0_9FLAO|nr:fumarylacetoacetate hydrolase family protein [Mesohalobacter halotolerans]MBS3739323.1 fumarylacetoacetate hydrolase family protein [Psychroflexus sp.]TKS55922.1 fumarylacetoacetate hydrolase family protein [Mesohalobacter halotolerans]
MKIICIGRNYTEHISELKNKKPDNPVVFIKPDSSVLPKSHPFVIPEFSSEVHHEVELLVKINKLGKYIQPHFAHKYYQKIGLGIDFTARDLQSKLKAKGLPWEKAKGFDGATLIGRRWFDKTDFDLSNLNFSLLKNNDIVQNGNTKLMLWTIDELIAYVSQFFTLKIGDIIFTGTPSGVGKIKENDVLIGKIEDHEIFKVNVK